MIQMRYFNSYVDEIKYLEKILKTLKELTIRLKKEVFQKLLHRIILGFP